MFAFSALWAIYAGGIALIGDATLAALIGGVLAIANTILATREYRHTKAVHEIVERRTDIGAVPPDHAYRRVGDDNDTDDPRIWG